jgi:hypothetical protein
LSKSRHCVRIRRQEKEKGKIENPVDGLCPVTEWNPPSSVYGVALLTTQPRRPVLICSAVTLTDEILLRHGFPYYSCRDSKSEIPPPSGWCCFRGGGDCFFVFGKETEINLL